ncbi:MAG: GGDEF domain-containing protein, partial [Wujia sp.]
YLNEHIFQSSDEIHSDEISENKEIYSPILTKYTRDYKSSETFVEHVPSASVLSDIVEASTEKIYLGITPLYFREKIIGFITMDHLYCNSYLPMFYTWLICTCSSIGNHCLQVELKMLIDTLDNMYINDSLTGLNNRFGLHRYAEKLIKRAEREGRCIFGIEIDLDRLKIINDTYGHTAGDNAIIQIANAMRFATDDGFILSRIGGDEYFILGMCDDEGAAQSFINKVNIFLDTYNNDNTLPYYIECSCGYFVSKTGTHDLEEIMKITDIEMYKVKNKKRTKSE